MKGISTFSAVVIFIFVLLTLFGVFVFATFTATSRAAVGEVEVWGSVEKEVLDALLTEVRDTREDFKDVSYTEIPEDVLVPRLVEAIAAGRGPDLVLFPSDRLVRDGEKLATISYDVVSRREFQDSFVEAGEVFLRDDGILALPFSIDPTVMYWNRTLFSNAGIAQPPRLWDELVKIAPALTEKQPNGSLSVSAVALGQWDNVAHAKDVLVTLVRQLGLPIVTATQNGYRADLIAVKTDVAQPGVSAVRFLADFADPVKPTYSWNRSQKNSRDAFLAGTLAIYFAPASELLGLRDANPNLNFDVAQVPQSRGAGKDVSAHVVGAAIPRGTGNPAGALQVALELTTSERARRVAELMTLPSTRRDVTLDASRDAFLDVFQASALRSFAFLDINPPETDRIFSRMMENISSGRTTLTEAVSRAQSDLQELLRVQ